MNDLTTKFPQRMTTLEISQLTGKEHKHVLRDFRNIIKSNLLEGSNFGPREYLDSRGKVQSCFSLDLRATLLLISGYSDELRLRIIDRWMELEKQETSFAPRDGETEAIRREFEALKGIAEVCGYTGNQALLAADNAMKRIYGLSPTALLRIELKSPENEALIIATEIGKRFDPPKSPNFVNLTLKNMGFLERVEYKANKFDWRLTEKGKQYGTYLDVGKEHSDGTPVQQIKWKESVVPLLSSYLDELSLP